MPVRIDFDRFCATEGKGYACVVLAGVYIFQMSTSLPKVIFFHFFCLCHLGVSKKKLTWCTIQKVVHNARNGAQMPLFSYPGVHKCL